MSIGEDIDTELVSTNKDSTIIMTSIGKNRVIKGVGGSNNKINEVDDIDITNTRSVNISKIAKSKNLV